MIDFYRGTDDAFNIGDVVNVIVPENYIKTEYAFGINKCNWEQLIETNPHVINDVIVNGPWEGYVLSDSRELTGFSLCWPAWGLEHAGIKTQNVDDLL